MAVVRASFREWYKLQHECGVAVADTVTSASATPKITLKLQHDLWFVYLQLPPYTMPATTIKQQQLQHQARAPLIMAWHMRFCVCHAIIIRRAHVVVVVVHVWLSPLRTAWCVRDEKQQHVFASTRASVADNSTPHAVLLSRFFTHSTWLRITRCVHYTPLTQRVKVKHDTI